MTDPDFLSRFSNQNQIYQPTGNSPQNSPKYQFSPPPGTVVFKQLDAPPSQSYAQSTPQYMPLNQGNPLSQTIPNYQPFQAPVNNGMPNSPLIKQVHIEQPVYYEKRVIVENRQETDALKRKLDYLQNHNNELKNELNRILDNNQHRPNQGPDSKFSQAEQLVKSLLEEIQNLNEQINSKNSENQNLRYKNQILEQQNQDIPVYQNLNQSLGKQVEHLDITSRARLQEIERLSKAKEQLEQQNRELPFLREELKQCSDKISEKQRENEYIKNQFDNLINTHNRVVPQLENQVKDLTNDLSTVTSENQRLAQALRNKLLENDSLKNLINDSKHLQEDNQSLIVRATNQAREIESLKYRLSDYEEKLKENENRLIMMAMELERLQNQNQDLLRQNPQVERDNKKLSQLLVAREQEIQELQQNLYNQDQKASEKRDLEDRLMFVMSENNRLVALNQQLIADLDYWKQKASRSDSPDDSKLRGRTGGLENTNQKGAYF